MVREDRGRSRGPESIEEWELLLGNAVESLVGDGSILERKERKRRSGKGERSGKEKTERDRERSLGTHVAEEKNGEKGRDRDDSG